MRTSNNEVFVAPTPDELLDRQVGWHVPLAGLRYWIVGRTQPHTTVGSLELDGVGRLKTLEQAGWTIRYQRYEAIGDLQLPTKLELENPRLSARLVSVRQAP